MKKAVVYVALFMDYLRDNDIEARCEGQLLTMFDCFMAGLLSNTSPLERKINKMDEIIESARDMVPAAAAYYVRPIED